MTPRKVVALFAAGILVIGLAAWVATRNQYGARNSVDGMIVLPGLEQALNSVTEVRIRAAGQTGTKLKKHGDDWIVAERGYPADFGKLRRLLLDLGSLKAIERKTRLARNYPVLGVEDVSSPKATGSRVDIVASGKTWSIIVGNSMDANSGYVRVVDSKQSLLASPLLQVDATPSQWLEPIVVDLKQNRVREIEEQPAKGPRFSVSRDKQGQADFTVHGIPRGRELSGPKAADSMASALSNLTLTDVSKAGTAPRAADLSHAVFKTFDGLEVDVDGYQSGEKHYIALLARATDKSAEPEAKQIEARTTGWDYEIPAYRYSEIFQPLDGLLKPLPKKHSAKAAQHRPRVKRAR
jgi:hypothetical protein